MMCYRAVQLERELEGMRTRGVDLSAKQQEIEVARRAAKDAELHYHEAHKCVVITPVESSFLSKGFVWQCLPQWQHLHDYCFQ